MSVRNINELRDKKFDVFVIGAGINGAVSAAALSAKGLSVALIDQGDFASMTSSNSSNLAWGGIKYLESHEYFLVNNLCKSRNHLMRSYPSSVKEIRFLTSIQKGFRFHPLFIYMGSLLYWLLGRGFTELPKYMTVKGLKKNDSRIDNRNLSGGIEYSDAFLIDNDAKFVFNFVKKAASTGAAVKNYVSCHGFSREGDVWKISLKDMISGNVFDSEARFIVNACGPLVDKQNQLNNIVTEHKHLFSKGVHLIVDSEMKQKKVLAFFASDGRLFFVLPMGDKTCIGTTDTKVNAPISYVTDEDIEFILKNVNKVLDIPAPLTSRDIISTRCGVRPLAIKSGDKSGDWLQLSRKHKIDFDKKNCFLSIFGGKLTDCINVGDEVSGLVSSAGITGGKDELFWYGEASDFEKNTFFKKAQQILKVNDAMLESFWRRWDVKAYDILELVEADYRMSEIIIAEIGMIRAEIHLTKKYDMIENLEDFLRRRTYTELVVKHEELINRDEIKEICDILFGENGSEELNRYISSKGVSA